MATPGTYIVCSYCGAPLLVERDMAYRLKYHPKCKRDVDRERYRRPESDGHACYDCGQSFAAKRSDAKYCSPRCLYRPADRAHAPTGEPVSIHSRKLARRDAKGREVTVYDVRLRDANGKPYKRTFTKKEDARAFEGGQVTNKASGSLADPKGPAADRRHAGRRMAGGGSGEAGLFQSSGYLDPHESCAAGDRDVPDRLGHPGRYSGVGERVGGHAFAVDRGPDVLGDPGPVLLRRY